MPSQPAILIFTFCIYIMNLICSNNKTEKLELLQRFQNKIQQFVDFVRINRLPNSIKTIKNGVDLQN